MPIAADVAARVRRLMTELDVDDLRPRPPVDAAFEQLVAIALRHRGADAERVLAALGTEAQRIRALCARGEAALERHWSERIASAPDPYAELACFPYVHNYERLVALELSVVRGVGARPQRVAVLGSGPLPLTGVELARRHDLDVLLVDRDAGAATAGDSLVRALGLGERISTVRADVGSDALDLRDADLVVHGAMVGPDAASKSTLLASVSAAMRYGAHLVVRSAAGLRSLLYPPATLDGVGGITMLLEAHPYDDVVNSVLVARRVRERRPDGTNP